ncbi:XRE family transcriptional regulator [bacterium D16-50]|nr:XRE family transcriptional regulator [bacterium D16-50]
MICRAVRSPALHVMRKRHVPPLLRKHIVVYGFAISHAPHGGRGEMLSPAGLTRFGYGRKGTEMRKNLKEARRRAGLTQQQMADQLEISLRYYQNIEAGDRTGDFILWDELEDITGIHQRILREIS